MARPWLVACWLAVACSAPAQPTRTATTTIEQDVALAEGSVHLVVDHGGNEAWGRAIVESAAAYLPVAERWLGVPFARIAPRFFGDAPPPWTIRIVGRPEVFLGALHIGGYNNSSGVFGPDRGIFVEYGFARIGDPALVLHELTHFWFRGGRPALAGPPPDPHASSWFIEGACSHVPIAIAETGTLALPADKIAAMRAHWGEWFVQPAASDVAIERDTRREGRTGIFYGKSYRVQLVLARVLGSDRYRDLIHRAALQRLPASDDVLALLAAVDATTDWHSLLLGWVFPGDYTTYPPPAVARFHPRP